jgi:hypothetical protein
MSDQSMESRMRAYGDLGDLVLRAAADERDGIGDSDLEDEQPVVVMIKTTLGHLRAAGLRLVPGYYPEQSADLPHSLTLRSIAHNMHRQELAGGMDDVEAEDLARRYIATLNLAAEGGVDAMVADAVRTWKALHR